MKTNDDLVAESQQLGRDIEAQRDRRRAINAELERRRKATAAQELLRQLDELGAAPAQTEEA